MEEEIVLYVLDSLKCFIIEIIDCVMENFFLLKKKYVRK